MICFCHPMVKVTYCRARYCFDRPSHGNRTVFGAVIEVSGIVAMGYKDIEVNKYLMQSGPIMILLLVKPTGTYVQINNKTQFASGVPR